MKGDAVIGLNEPIKILNLGAGVQSTCVLLKSCFGELPKLDHAIFADTGDEPKAVYRHLERLIEVANRHGIPVHVVRHKEWPLSKHLKERIAANRRLETIPAFTKSAKGKYAPMLRSCTREFKVVPIVRQTKKLLGLSRTGRWPKELAVETWLGISRDESDRMKNSTNKWQRFWHPLIETTYPDPKIRPDSMTRSDCVEWLKKKGWGDTPRSACVFCPFHSDHEWSRLRDEDVAGWKHAVEIDEVLRSGRDGKVHGMRETAYLHRSLVPLAVAKIGDEDGTFSDECAGVCGV